MSIKVSTYVWKHAKHRGTTKMLLLAMADFANDSGICWPSAATLAERINESERHTRRMIKELVADGDLLSVPGGGRGHTTRYAIAIGMTDKQRERLNSVLQNSVSDDSVLQNTDIQETVTSEHGNSDIWVQETVTSGVVSDPTRSAPECAKPTKKRGGIRHVDPLVDPIRDSIPVPKHDSRAVRAPPSSAHQELMAAYREALGCEIPNGAKEAAAAKKILAHDYTPDQAIKVYWHLKAQDWWSEKHLSLVTVYEQIGAVLTARKSTNGSNGNGTRNRQPANAHIPNRPASTAQAEFEREYFRQIGVDVGDL